MQELVAKRYVKAIRAASSASDLENICELFSALAESFKDAKFNQVVGNPSVNAEQKKEILLSAVKPAQSEAINNFMSLLVEKGRIDVIPAMAKELRLEIARQNKRFTGTVYSNSEMDSSAVEGLGNGLSKKVDATVVLDFVKSDVDGVKVEVPDLNIEINFSKSRVNAQLVDHILKAI